MNLTDINSDIFSATDKGLVRKKNEDSYGTAETPNGCLCVLCDGMGGHSGGEEASRIAVDCITQYLSREKYPDVPYALKEAIEFANMQIVGRASENPELRGMGTTACVLLVRDDEVWYAHAGDSRIYLFVAGKKRLHRLTLDHSFVQGLILQDMITEEEAEKHPDKNKILKALGVKNTANAEVCKDPALPAKGDIFLICSDGLSGMVSDRRMEEILADSRLDMKQKETELMNEAKKAGGVDNITFQMVRISKSARKDSSFESKSSPSQEVLTTTKTAIGSVAAVLGHSWRMNVGVLAAAVLASILLGGIGGMFWKNESNAKEFQQDRSEIASAEAAEADTSNITENNVSNLDRNPSYHVYNNKSGNGTSYNKAKGSGKARQSSTKPTRDSKPTGDSTLKGAPIVTENSTQEEASIMKKEEQGTREAEEGTQEKQGTQKAEEGTQEEPNGGS